MAGDALPKPGDLIGVRYRIESMLGQGGMGAVFAAVNQATGRSVAIKWMLPGAARSQESLARFLAEARATAKIEHPNVIQVLDVGQAGECPFLVMERLRGRSLGERLTRGRLSPHETLSVILPACRGVAEAHNEGILHRDLKPDNIFLCEGKDGSPRPPKVLDFGISKLYEEGGGQSLTRTGVAMGTPQYMSPEQLSAAADADVRLDVYAMGVVLYECLTGRPPYDGDGLFELVQQIAAGSPTPIRHLAPDVSPELEAVVMRAMASDRDHRHSSMHELVLDLERVSQRVQGGSAPHPALPSTAAAFASSLPGASTPVGGTGAHHGHSAQPSSGGFAPGAVRAPSRGSSKLPIVLGCGALALLLFTLSLGGAAYLFFQRDAADPAIEPTGGGPSARDVFDLGGQTEPTGSSDRTPRIDVTFSGACNPRFNNRLMVTGNAGSLNVMSTNMVGMTGAIMLTLEEEPGTINLSTQHRMDTQTAINVMVGQRLWTNMTIDIVAVQAGRIPDPVSGSITVTELDATLAVADVTFNDLTLQSTQDGSLCTLNGRLQTFGTTYGM